MQWSHFKREHLKELFVFIIFSSSPIQSWLYFISPEQLLSRSPITSTSAISIGQFSVLIFFDLSSSFATVDHSHLIKTLFKVVSGIHLSVETGIS